MTIPARYTLTEAHFRIAELEKEVRALQTKLDRIAELTGTFEPNDPAAQEIRDLVR